MLENLDLNGEKYLKNLFFIILFSVAELLCILLLINSIYLGMHLMFIRNVLKRKKIENSEILSVAPLIYFFSRLLILNRLP